MKNFDMWFIYVTFVITLCLFTAKTYGGWAIAIIPMLIVTFGLLGTLVYMDGKEEEQ